MAGEKDLARLLSTLEPRLQEGEFVFCHVKDLMGIDPAAIVLFFREEEGITVILPKAKADELRLDYGLVAAWITLTVHSSLEAVGLTAAFATALAEAGLSCNVVAGYYHDHLFVGKDDARRALGVLEGLRGREGAVTD